ncbi:MAG: hypothetical protein ACI97A_002896 [Planctomycetota bacterium]
MDGNDSELLATSGAKANRARRTPQRAPWPPTILFTVPPFLLAMRDICFSLTWALLLRQFAQTPMSDINLIRHQEQVMSRKRAKLSLNQSVLRHQVHDGWVSFKRTPRNSPGLGATKRRDIISKFIQHPKPRKAVGIRNVADLQHLHLDIRGGQTSVSENRKQKQALGLTKLA